MLMVDSVGPKCRSDRTPSEDVITGWSQCQAQGRGPTHVPPLPCWLQAPGQLSQPLSQGTCHFPKGPLPWLQLCHLCPIILPFLVKRGKWGLELSTVSALVGREQRCIKAVLKNLSAIGLRKGRVR